MELGWCKSRFTIVPKRTNVLPTPVATNKTAGRNYNCGQDKFWVCPGSKPKTLQLHLHLLRTWSEGRVPWVTWTWYQRHQDTTRAQEAHTYYDTSENYKHGCQHNPGAHSQGYHLQCLHLWSCTSLNYTMKLDTQHVFDCLICTNTQEMHIPI
jgi:hypothetical protein